VLIDPFTVVAQIINFALLIWLLTRFLYGPVTRAMEAREARVREELASAELLRAEAAAEGERYRGLIDDFEGQRETLFAEVRAEAEALRQEQVRQVRAEVGELRERWKRALEQEKEAFLRDLRLQVGQGSLEVIRNALRELAGVDLEELLIARFLARLREMSAADRDRLVAAARQDGGLLRLRTAFPLSHTQREVLTRQLAETFGADSIPQFDTDPDLLAGVELRAGGVKVAWTLDDYLRALEEGMREAFHGTSEVETSDVGS